MLRDGLMTHFMEPRLFMDPCWGGQHTTEVVEKASEGQKPGAMLRFGLVPKQVLLLPAPKP